jgi:hypothetical protein
MTARLRNLLLLTGLLLVAMGLLLLAYSLWPLPVAQEAGTIPATLFAPP